MRVYNAGARPQRLLWATTGTKDPKASDIADLAAPFTVNTMPEGTLKALADHGVVRATMPADGGDCEEILERLAGANIDVHSLSVQIQDEGAKSFVNAWNDLMAVIRSKCAVLQRASEPPWMLECRGGFLLWHERASARSDAVEATPLGNQKG
jgi:transaldolase